MSERGTKEDAMKGYMKEFVNSLTNEQLLNLHTLATQVLKERDIK